MRTGIAGWNAARSRERAPISVAGMACAAKSAPAIRPLSAWIAHSDVKGESAASPQPPCRMVLNKSANSDKLERRYDTGLHGKVVADDN